ncbi:MAG: hypothetical protein OFPII_29600 [Osedax symbiont Rs1]|nr:MAG: hypothetical protein OFPII_29600 [Osedax symbiont Rs1]
MSLRQITSQSRQLKGVLSGLIAKSYQIKLLLFFKKNQYKSFYLI